MKEGKFNVYLLLEQQNIIFIYGPENPCNTVGDLLCLQGKISQLAATFLCFSLSTKMH